jgi:glycosyltransferase involved in cell wall biosynthesis
MNSLQADTSSPVAGVKRSILVVSPTVPWPPRRNGFALRYLPLLEHLAQRHSVDLLVLGDRGAWNELGPLNDWGRVHLVDTRSGPPTLARRMATIARGLIPGSAPYVLRSAWTGEVVRAVLGVAAQRRYDVLLWTSPAHLEAALKIAQKRPAARCVFDLIDSPTRLETRPGSTAKALADVRDIRRWEGQLQRTADRVIYISAADAAAAAEDGMAARTSVVPNGVYLNDFAATADAAIARTAGSKTILFFGHMSYEPNVDAAVWLAREIMPQVRLKVPGAQLVIAGHQPADAVRELADGHTIVTGSVPSIWPYIKAADACVFPMRMGAGLQNKILEAMAMGAPIVTTSKCVASIPAAVSGEHLLVADTAAQISEATVRVLSDAALARRLGDSGPGFVHEHYDWKRRAEDFERALFVA